VSHPLPIVWRYSWTSQDGVAHAFVGSRGRRAACGLARRSAQMTTAGPEDPRCAVCSRTRLVRRAA
jgi:hypothetical protein